MNYYHVRIIVSLILLLTVFRQMSSQESDSSAQYGHIVSPDLMTKKALVSEIEQASASRMDAYEKIKTDEDIAAWQNARKEFLLRQLGPMWDKTPLNAKITGTVEKPGFHVEKILFESMPGFYVTASAFVPDAKRFPAPWPAVLEVCGHSKNGKAYDSYQRVAALGATNGLLVLVMDPIEQGERVQYYNERGEAIRNGVPAHNLIGASSLLLGRNTATFEVFDMIRALDYLQSRPDVIPDRLGVTGCSGGGTQTSYIMALDDRVCCAAPSCYLCSISGKLTHEGNPQDAEQNIFGQLSFGMDHADYIIMRAPKPTLLCTSTRDFFNIEDTWDSYRQAKRIYTRLGHGLDLGLVEVDSVHGYPQLQREAAIRWMLRYLAGREEYVQESSEMAVLTDDEIRSVPAPGVIALEGCRPTWQWNQDLAREYKETRDEAWKTRTPDEARLLVREVAGIHALADLPAPKVDSLSENGLEQILTAEPGIALPLVLNRLPQQGECLTLFLSDQGRKGDTSKAVLASDSPVASVDLRGWGETQGMGPEYYDYKFFGQDGTEYYLAILLGKSYIGMRTDDLLQTTRYLKETYGVSVQLEAEGYARSVALHAAIAEPQLFSGVLIRDSETLPLYQQVIDQPETFHPLTDMIHGVLKSYDLDNLRDFVSRY